MTNRTFDYITYEVEKGRARITLNRPEKRNALSMELVEELRDALWEADDDKAVHCVILKGAGTSFCAGYDLTAKRQAVDDGVKRRKGAGFDDDTWRIERFQRSLRTLTEMHKPTIAQIHGHCYAGGTDLALYCDMLICADNASIGYSALRNMGAAPNQMWLYHIGPQWTKRLLLTGDTLSGEDAAKIGLVLKSVPEEHLEGEVEGLADRLSWIDPEMLSTNKRIINVGMELMGSTVLQRLAAENDARAHTTQAARDVFKQIGTEGLRAALRDRDAPFGDSRARVEGPELRDEDGRLIPLD
ncbi:MAG: crotonase/enoyl-CoA hydratase family protein [Gammaproteobacteria bacterium]|jgi:enoyl-CoA hydratase|nr:crotonase/enoyl-CoA hydratase family protein [Gammaproteobacteria bacterium]MBT3869695.1 crotonase/enoyl-CoA hydratase family protein [Gammaproteobacteria bacterium]MBT4378618.1 crotonase/enoyl-CoA hydratase family protein [Gammaproteobacteria bacterium]MBT4619043.1 crotonase/enoyl-CoA hydratase family protein [Gammaproteobacteria bacterium]MBT5196986.1 crotonase/enoyl-CoA hydratase family protein [Gammaproteobacteria bacterium]